MTLSDGEYVAPFGCSNQWDQSISYHAHLTCNFCCSDNLPIVKLGSWPLNAEMFDSDVMKGPIPTLFAEDPAQALEAIQSGIVRAHADMQKIMRCFFIPESVDPMAALKLFKNPR